MDDQRFDRFARLFGRRHSRRKAIAIALGATAGIVGVQRERAGAGTPCVLTCPPNVITDSQPGLCSAVVNYTAPAPIGTCGIVICDPPAGSVFNSGVPGETLVTCIAGSATCSFLVTVTDAELPIITCPANIELESADPIAVDYTPTASDNCPGVTTFCNPPSGSEFGPGMTEVVCSALENAPDQSTVTCSFNVTITAPTPTPTEPPQAGPTSVPTDVPSTEVPATEVPTAVDPTAIPGDPTATTAPVSELPNTGAGAGDRGSGMLLPLAIAGAGAAAVARLGMRGKGASDSPDMNE